MALLLVSLLLSKKLDKLLQVLKAEHGCVTSPNPEGIGESKIGPCEGEGADLVRLRIGEEDPLFSPGRALRQQRKGLANERMKRVSNDKMLVTIGVIRWS